MLPVRAWAWRFAAEIKGKKARGFAFLAFSSEGAEGPRTGKNGRARMRFKDGRRNGSNHCETSYMIKYHLSLVVLKVK